MKPVAFPVLLAAVAAIASAAIAPAEAQVQLQLKLSFVDPQSGGNGDAGVARDTRAGEFFVVDGTNQQTVHRFDANGVFLSQFTTATCSPKSTAPSGVTYDPLLDSLWVLDDNLTGTALSFAVVQIDRSGTCQGGFGILPPSTRPDGIAYRHVGDSLWVASSGQVSEWDKQGNRGGGGFAFTTPFGNRRLTGIAYLLPRDHFLIVADNDPLLYEVDLTGRVVSVEDLAPYGITNPQGAHFDPVTATLSVVDGGQSRVYVFDVGLCTGTVARFGTGCNDPTGTPLRLEASGCPALGSMFQVALRTGAANTMQVWFAIGASKTRLPNGTPLPLDLTPLGAPGCSLYTSSVVLTGPYPNPGGGASLAVTVPNNPVLLGLDLHFQGYQFGGSIPTPLPVVTSDALTIHVG